MHRTTPRRRVEWRAASAPATAVPALLALPQDCLSAVLAALPPRALANLCGASRSLKHAASDSKLWAPHCRTQWPEDEEQPPSRLRYGARCRLFASLTICATHLEPGQKLVAQAAVGAMGGRWQASLTTAATHLLCGAAFTAKTRGASASTRLVTYEWLWATVREARRQPEAAFRPPLLHGATVSVSGLPAVLKTKVEEVVRRHGGEFSASLRHPSQAANGRRGSTHMLVVSREASSKEKLAAAARWGVPVLSLRWLSDSVADGKCGSPERYRL